jgi:hypothetical protein
MGFVLYPPTKETFLLLARFGLVATLSLSAIGFNVNSSNQDVEVTTTTTVQPPVIPSTVRTMSVPTELQMQLATRKAGSVKFWEAVSWCETNHKWNDGGYYAGGLGIAQSTWKGYGGWEFAKTAKKATKEEQITVANRIAFFGYQTTDEYITLDDRQNNKPFFRPAQGWRNMKKWGIGCVNWKTRKPARERYTEAGIIEWKKSRGES